VSPTLEIENAVFESTYALFAASESFTGVTTEVVPVNVLFPVIDWLAVVVTTSGILETLDWKSLTCEALTIIPVDLSHSVNSGSVSLIPPDRFWAVSECRAYGTLKIWLVPVME